MSTDDIVVLVIAPFLAAFAVAGVLTWRLIKARGWLRIMDQPTHRSLHDRPVPRTGGVAIVAALIVVFASISWAEPLADTLLGFIVGAGLVIASVSFIDDRYDIPARYRFVVHIAVAGGLWLSGVGLEAISLPGWAFEVQGIAAALLSVIFMVWFVNLYNFMDGMDGLAGGMATGGFLSYGVLGWMAGYPDFTALSVTLAGASAGFLAWNFPPARIFMGDVGASMLGLVAGALTVYASSEGIFPLWIGLLVFSPFLIDATVTLLRRAFKGERIWEAHCSHYYQRSVRSVLGLRPTLLCEYVLIMGCGVSAVLAVSQPAERQWAVLALWGVIYVTLAVSIRASERRRGPESA